MKIISWNLNGLLSCLENGSFAPIENLTPDVICLQEIRTHQKPEVLPGYRHIWNPGEREGYSGTALLTREKPICTHIGFGDGNDPEGRTIAVEYNRHIVVGIYTPNSQKNLQRHAYRMEWDEGFHAYILRLKRQKPIIICGDFNVTLSELDIYEENLREHWAQLGFASDERSNLEALLDEGFTDVFRHLYPDRRSYTWWSNRLGRRKVNRGWRLDYFLVSNELLPKVKRVEHLEHIHGSDHCPILLEVDV